MEAGRNGPVDRSSEQRAKLPYDMSLIMKEAML